MVNMTGLRLTVSNHEVFAAYYRPVQLRTEFSKNHTWRARAIMNLLSTVLRWVQFPIGSMRLYSDWSRLYSLTWWLSLRFPHIYIVPQADFCLLESRAVTITLIYLTMTSVIRWLDELYCAFRFYYIQIWFACWHFLLEPISIATKVKIWNSRGNLIHKHCNNIKTQEGGR